MPFSETMRISVAMCTYNGGRFLSEQLESIARQTRLPDELVVCDDRSTDDTAAILRAFARTASFPVRIHANTQNLGFAANFENAIRRCQGDCIALSDQDDVWYPTRLQRSARELTSHPEVGMVFSDADLIDEQGHLMGQTLWQRLGFDVQRQRELRTGRYHVLVKHRFVTGATMMFRAALRDRCLPIAEGWVHDEWIAMMGVAFADLRPLDEPLIRYRIHGSQQVGLANKLQSRAIGNTPAERHWDRVRASARELQQLCDALSHMVPVPGGAVMQAYREHLDFLLFRAGLPASKPKRLARILAGYLRYRKHASGIASAGKDIVLEKHR